LTIKKGYWKDDIVKSYLYTLNGQFLHKGNNFPFYGFPGAHYIKDKGIWVLRLEVFSDRQLLEEEGLNSKGKDQSTKD